MSESKLKNAVSGIAEQLPMDRLKGEAQNYGHALAEHGMTRLGEHVEGLTGHLNDFASGGGKAGAAKRVMEGESPVKAGVKSAATKVKDAVKSKLGGGGGKSNKLKVTNIYETIDVPLPREVAYKQWTQFEEFPKFTKKVENVQQEKEEKVKWQAQIFWSHRSWDATIIDQVPPERIVWKSMGRKGHVDGSITFHELSPDLTRIIMVLEYYPKGLFEHTGNIWRAQGRRARLEFKHVARHMSTQTILHQDEQQGWMGEIHDSHVQEQQDQGEGGEDQDQNQQDQDQDQDQTQQDQDQTQQDQDQEQASDQGESDAGEAESEPGEESTEGDEDQSNQGEQAQESDQSGQGQPSQQKSGQGQQSQQKPQGQQSQGQQSQQKPQGQQSQQGQKSGQSQQKSGQGQSQQKAGQGQQKSQGQQGGGQQSGGQNQQNQQSGSGDEGQ